MNVKKIMVVVGLVIGLVGLAQAADFRQLLNEEKAALGATHVAVLDYADVTSVTATNTSATVTITNAVGAYSALAGIWYELPQTWGYTFTGAAITNGMTNVTLTVGVPSSTTNCLTSTEMGSSGTTVYSKWGQGPAAFITMNTVATTSLVFTVAGNPYGALSQVTSGQARVYFRILTRSTRIE